MLGRAAQARGQTCEPNLMISYQCGLVFRACCVKGQENSDFVRGDGTDLQDPGNSSPSQRRAVCLYSPGRVCLWVSFTVGATFLDSTNHRLKILEKRGLGNGSVGKMLAVQT